MLACLIFHGITAMLDLPGLVAFHTKPAGISQATCETSGEVDILSTSTLIRSKKWISDKLMGFIKKVTTRNKSKATVCNF